MSGKENLTGPEAAGIDIDAGQQDFIDMEGSVSAHSLEEII